jgi:hypothetical protein
VDRVPRWLAAYTGVSFTTLSVLAHAGGCLPGSGGGVWRLEQGMRPS